MNMHDKLSIYLFNLERDMQSQVRLADSIKELPDLYQTVEDMKIAFEVSMETQLHINNTIFSILNEMVRTLDVKPKL